MMETRQRPTWDGVWMATADAVGARSLCDRAQVGCVIVSTDNRVVSTGYNGPPPGYETKNIYAETLSCSSWCPRACKTDNEGLAKDYSDDVASHAEMNAGARASFVEARGGTAYVNSSVCYMCAKFLSALGVARVVMKNDSANDYRSPDKSINFMRSCGITVDIFGTFPANEFEVVNG